ncbi:hypothetical protein RND81_14G107600 [Saponaria officinalis]|uniref:Fe2OG dioxygenase domain-containing protein n=1 Tax=Saponaria officinalis TaxID=3572 RepID=A0AAW1GWH4_SAPOF
MNTLKGVVQSTEKDSENRALIMITMGKALVHQSGISITTWAWLIWNWRDHSRLHKCLQEHYGCVSWPSSQRFHSGMSKPLESICCHEKIIKKIMEKFVSSWSDGKKLPEKYVFPPGKRPGKVVITTPKNIPVIDIGKAVGLDRSVIIQQLMQASQEFGFFQVINHGVVSALLDDTRGVFEEFFALPADEKVDLCSSDKSKNCLFLTSNVAYDKEEFHNWRDTLRIKGSPLEEHKQEWPLKPVRFRDIVGDYTNELRNLALRILELICEGLGLEKNYFDKGLSEEEFLVVHQYPTCPDPSLTLGTRSHTDPGLIGIVLQGDIPGLQVMNDGEWIGVEVIPGAFVVNVGFVLEVISFPSNTMRCIRPVPPLHSNLISYDFMIGLHSDS